jgi:thioredoxin-dependent peroxiredoxin
MLPELRAHDAEVVGVSTDDFDRQCEFARSLALEFPLVADPDGAISGRYQVLRSFHRVDRRVVYVIDPAGRIAAAFHHELRIGALHDEVQAFFANRG